MLFLTLCCSLSGKSSECEDTVYSDLKQNTDRGERNTHIISSFKRDVTITVQMITLNVPNTDEAFYFIIIIHLCLLGGSAGVDATYAQVFNHRKKKTCKN